MIYDRLGDIGKASTFYKRAIDKCEEPEQSTMGEPTENHKQQHYYLKALTNYSVTLEKLGRREEALILLDGKVKRQFGQEIRVHNNLGIIQKRTGQAQEAEASYHAALEIDSESFFPNYNLAVLKAQTQDYAEARTYFKKALHLAQSTHEEVYQVNVYMNLAMIEEKLGDLTEALQNLNSAQALEPTNQKIRTKIQQIVNILAAQ